MHACVVQLKYKLTRPQRKKIALDLNLNNITYCLNTNTIKSMAADAAVEAAAGACVGSAAGPVGAAMGAAAAVVGKALAKEVCVCARVCARGPRRMFNIMAHRCLP